MIDATCAEVGELPAWSSRANSQSRAFRSACRLLAYIDNLTLTRGAGEFSRLCQLKVRLRKFDCSEHGYSAEIVCGCSY